MSESEYKRTPKYRERTDAVYDYDRASQVIWASGTDGVSFRTILLKCHTIIPRLRTILADLESHSVIVCASSENYLDSVYRRGAIKYDHTQYWFWPPVSVETTND